MCNAMSYFNEVMHIIMQQLQDLDGGKNWNMVARGRFSAWIWWIYYCSQPELATDRPSFKTKCHEAACLPSHAYHARGDIVSPTFCTQNAPLHGINRFCKFGWSQTTEKSSNIYSPSILTPKDQSIFSTLLFSPEWEDIFSLHTFRRGWWIAFNLRHGSINN